MKKLLCFLGLASVCLAQTSNPYTNVRFGPTVITATGITPAIDLRPPGASGSNAFPSAVLTLVGSSLTTATVGITASADNGVTYVPINICPVATPSTCATTETATANGSYLVPNLGGFDHIKYVTSGTFTATNISLTLSAAPNGFIARNTGGGGGGGTCPTGSAGVIQATDGTNCESTNLVMDVSKNLTQTGNLFVTGIFNASTNFQTAFNSGTSALHLTFNGDNTDTGRLGFEGGSDANLQIWMPSGGDVYKITSGASPVVIGVLPGLDPAITVGQAVCVKSLAPLVLGKCTSVVGAGGACTCS